MDESVREEKSSFKMLVLFLPNLITALTLALLLKLPPGKIRALIRSMKFLSPEVALYLCKSTILSCTEYCCHEWAVAPRRYLDMLDRLQKLVCRAVGPSLAASLEPLTNCQNVASLSFFTGITLVNVHMNWLNWQVWEDHSLF